MPLTEAMVQGCPIACSVTSCFPEICGDVAAYFDPKDIGDMSYVIETLVEQPKNRMSAMLSSRALQFSWLRCATETAQVYRMLA